jgi:hypothetical protein
MAWSQTNARRDAKKASLNSTPVSGGYTWVANGAKLKCQFGSAPSTLKVTKESTWVKSQGEWLATIDDYKPNKNVFPFGMCNKTSPPTPCSPATKPKWTPMVPSRTAGNKNQPALAYPNATLTCTKGCADCISIITPGQTKKKVDEPKEAGCWEGNLLETTENAGKGAVETNKVGHVKTCLNKNGLSVEITGAKQSITNAAGTTVEANSMTAGFSGTSGSPPSAGAHFVKGVVSQQTPAGVTSTDIGIGISAGSKSNGFGVTYGVGHKLPAGPTLP